MTWLATRLTTAAVALVVVAQAAASPGACCLIRSALFGGDACCRIAAAAAEPAGRSCCHGPAQATEAVAPDDRPAFPVAECLWCSAGPKVVANGRAAPLDLDVAPTFDSISAVEPASPAPASRRLVADEPFHRTALAACAWLCVWVI